MGYFGKIKPLIRNRCFPLSGKALKSFNLLKSELVTVFLGAIENATFVVEIDASDIAISATSNQKDRTIAFYSRSFN